VTFGGFGGIDAPEFGFEPVLDARVPFEVVSDESEKSGVEIIAPLTFFPSLARRPFEVVSPILNDLSDEDEFELFDLTMSFEVVARFTFEFDDARNAFGPDEMDVKEEFVVIGVFVMVRGAVSMRRAVGTLVVNVGAMSSTDRAPMDAIVIGFKSVTIGTGLKLVAGM